MGIENGSEAPVSQHGEMQDWGRGRWMARRALNDRWSVYTPVNPDGSRIIEEDGTLRRPVAIPRLPIISEATIAEMDEQWAIEESRAEAI